MGNSSGRYMGLNADSGAASYVDLAIALAPQVTTQYRTTALLGPPLGGMASAAYDRTLEP